MPAVSTEIPDNFSFVLRRYDRNANLALRFVCYGENTVSRSIELDGVVAPTIFLKTKPARDRATKLGWKDETEIFMSQRNSSITEPDKRTPRRRRKSKSKE